jgi:hypothetical protein
MSGLAKNRLEATKLLALLIEFEIAVASANRLLPMRSGSPRSP